MKKRNVILNVILIICVGLFFCAVYLFNSIFPKADPIEPLEGNDIVSVTLSCNTPSGTIPMSKQYYEDLILYIREAIPTRNQSLNDYPTARDYYGVEIRTDKIEYRYFVYKEGEQVYIEIPYTGIYKSKNELLELVSTYFTEG